MIALNIKLVNKIIALFAATNKCQFFVSSYQRALQKSQEGKIRFKEKHEKEEESPQFLEALSKFEKGVHTEIDNANLNIS